MGDTSIILCVFSSTQSMQNMSYGSQHPFMAQYNHHNMANMSYHHQHTHSYGHHPNNSQHIMNTAHLSGLKEDEEISPRSDIIPPPPPPETESIMNGNSRNRTQKIQRVNTVESSLQQHHDNGYHTKNGYNGINRDDVEDQQRHQSPSAGKVRKMSENERSGSIDYENSDSQSTTKSNACCVIL